MPEVRWHSEACQAQWEGTDPTITEAGPQEWQQKKEQEDQAKG